MLYPAGLGLSQRGNVLDLREDDPSLIVMLDPDQFVKELKETNADNWDPLPCNVMYAASMLAYTVSEYFIYERYNKF